MTQNEQSPDFPRRRWLLLGAFALAFGVLAWRALDLQIIHQGFLQDQGDARHLRVVSLPAHRGMILDRNGEPLAVSTPVDSVWANPQLLVPARDYLPPLARLLGLDVDRLQRLLAARADREFVYLRRHVTPTVAAQVRALDAPGVSLQREYHRYYPDGEVNAHLLGFTDIDDAGQEGLELAYDDWLRGTPGAKRVLRDGRQHVIEDVERLRAPRPGKDLRLSIDRRIQYLAYRELKAAVRRHRARSGSVVVLDVRSGEVLAMVNQPSFNPNNRRHLKPAQIRNRALTDVFEPGSTMKPFTIAVALASGRYRPDTPVDTRPGLFQVGVNTVRDVHNYGRLDVTGVIRKSSNVGAAKIALSLPRERLWQLYSDLGFGQLTASGFPGEASGLLAHHRRWHDIEQATMAFGYGLSVTPLQLAKAYAVLAADGWQRPVSLLRVEQAPAGRRLLPASVARQVRAMLEEAVGPEGTGQAARVQGYRVAGKTGTVHKATAGGYAEHRYYAVFAGLAPASRPRLVTVVMINEPSNGDYYGGKVAAPVFSRVMAGALRLLNVPPDDLGDADALRQAALREGGPA
ncbi:penicillin-binding transpeptidase domain-containing protein [Thiohalobacter sp. IOR34]|uniref:peptidoglycan D,D-transpeptidase FtsI family protein n=1 Tax=Thiohalobacter sp. IOR34 TaxID=3057176 RepID=UPI0025B04682|nr:penicillin-binding transpeptidase domain-containing protein [Thiohalobacter sp. IOR34]WJW75014.1 penicillin-binding transpeptidase domain-containing protein [Thiohalobacter sp. IOR34]